MNRMLKTAFIACGVVLAAAFPAWAETPQTDVAFIEQLSAKPADEVLKALELYYELHVSEIKTQSVRELNTGAFLARQRAEKEGDTAEATRQATIFEGTSEALANARQGNQDLRQDLAEMTGIDFGDDLAMAPDAPDALSPAPDGAPADLLAARDAAWANVEVARKQLRETRMQLLQDQEAYDKDHKVKIGQAMRLMTDAEVAMARAACDLRLIEARIALNIGKPLKEALE